MAQCSGTGTLAQRQFCAGGRASLQASDVQRPGWVPIPSGLPGPAGRPLPFSKSGCPRAATRSTFRPLCAGLQMRYPKTPWPGPSRTSSTSALWQLNSLSHALGPCLRWLCPEPLCEPISHQISWVTDAPLQTVTTHGALESFGECGCPGSRASSRDFTASSEPLNSDGTKNPKNLCQITIHQLLLVKKSWEEPSSRGRA